MSITMNLFKRIHVKWAMMPSSDVLGVAKLLSEYGAINVSYHKEEVLVTETKEKVTDVYVIEFDIQNFVWQKYSEALNLKEIRGYWM